MPSTSPNFDKIRSAISTFRDVPPEADTSKGHQFISRHPSKLDYFECAVLDEALKIADQPLQRGQIPRCEINGEGKLVIKRINMLYERLPAKQIHNALWRVRTQLQSARLENGRIVYDDPNFSINMDPRDIIDIAGRLNGRSAA